VRRGRLTKQQEFSHLFHKGGSVVTPTFTLRYLRNGLPQSRIGVVVSKKVSKKAVVRNRLRRQIIGWWQANEAKVKPGFDAAVIVKKDQETPAAQIETAFAKAGIVGGTDA
jgi:ribonuclease P protein component